MRSKPPCLVILVAALACAQDRANLDKCVKGCQQANNEVLNEVCGKECQTSCTEGCQFWWNALGSNCSSVCAESSPPARVPQCVHGCQKALESYSRNLAGDPSKHPRVEWRRARKHGAVVFRVEKGDLPPVFFRVQYKVQQKDWQYYDSGALFNLTSSSESYELGGFKPFTDYQFRLAWTVSPQFESLYTQASPVKTSEFGPPLGSPQKVTCALTTHNQVAVSWRPPEYPAGPQVSYLLEARDDHGNPPLVHELMTNSSDDQIVGYVFRALEPSRKYRVQVQASNRHGKGETAFCEVKTAEPDLNIGEGQAFATSGGHLYKFALGGSSGWGHRVFSFPENGSVITGMAANLQMRTLFLSDGHRVYVLDMDRPNSPTVLPIDVTRPSLLSYDWLNKRLFLLEEFSWQIKSCSVEKEFRCTCIVHGFDKISSPSKLIADPYNGYLFWMSNDETTGESVVSKADLILADEGESIHWRKAEEVHRAKNLRTFEIDFVQFRLYALDVATESIYSLDIDSGKRIENVRNQWKFYSNTSDMVYANDHFHLATSDGFYIETRSARDKTYATYSRCDNQTIFRLAVVDHKSAQPVPSPATPVENVRALFSVSSVRVLWDAPHPFKWQGRGVFQKFLYAVELTELITAKQIEPEGNFRSREATIDGLKRNTLYSVKVRAYSHMGAPGPESAAFVGKTFSETPLQLVWSLAGSERSIIASDVTGNNESQLVSPRLLHDSNVNAIAWYENTLFLGRNRSSLIRVDFGTGSSVETPGVMGVTCLAIERYAQKIYWGSLDKRAIFRCNFDGSRIERIVQNFVPHSLTVDSARGLLVWADQYGVYTSRLNGENLRVIYQNHVNSGRLVEGIAYDAQNGVAYWTSRSIEGVHVRSDRLMEEKSPLPPAIPLNDSSLKGPAMFLDGRLLWFDSRLQPVLTLPNGSYPVHFEFYSAHRRTAQHQHFTETLAVAQQVRQKNKMIVVPRNIDARRIKISGSWENFTIHWPKEASTQVDAFYKLRVSACDDDQDSCCSTEPSGPVHVLNTDRFVFPGNVRPYTKLAITLQAYTHWASTETVCRELRSPESIPTAPQNPKVFIAHRTTFPPSNDSSPEAEFRWSEPEHPNGNIIDYVLNCWYRHNGTGEITVWENLRVVGQSFSITSLVPNSTYFFKVSARTAAGEGPASPVLSINSNEEHPVPRLIVADRHSVQVSDVDNGNVTLVSNKVTNPVGIAYLDKTVFWLEQNGPIMASDMDGSNITVIHNSKKRGTCLTIDWVARKLYWAEYDADTLLSKISVLDLGNEKKVKTILELPKQHVNSLEADPFTSTLIYTISRTPREAAAIMLASIDGSNQRPLFPPRRRRHSDCHCSAAALKASVIALDPRSKKAPGNIYFADAETGNIWSADLHGCECSLVANASHAEGLPPDYITVDLQRVYWAQQGREEVFSLVKDSSKIGSAKIAHEVRNIRALNQQKYPDSSCMEIGAPTTAPALIIDQSTSLQIEVFPPDIAEQCSNISRPTIRYVVIYKKTGCLSSAEHCQQKEFTSVSATPVLENLSPHTNYTITYSYVDPYTHALHGPSPPSIFSTDDGAPEPVKNLRAFPLTPTSIRVRWSAELSHTKRPPQFEIRYSELNTAHPHNVTVIPHQRFGIEHSESIRGLKANTTYAIEVIAINSDKPGMRSGPSMIRARTYELPSELWAPNVSSRQMELHWKSGKHGQYKHILEYSLDGISWHPVNDNRSSVQTRPDYEHTFKISGLSPNTKFWFRLQILYRSEDVVSNNFTWPPEGSVFHTLEDAPSPPGTPSFQTDSDLSWQVPLHANGNGQLTYELQYRISDSNATTNWTDLYRGYSNFFPGSKLSLKKSYEFRVRARNAVGPSDWSDPSVPLTVPDVPGAYTSNQQTLKTIVKLVIVFGVVILLSGWLIIPRLLQPEKKTPSPDIGLVRIDRFPACSNFVHQHNELYFCGMLLSDPELAALPMINSDRIRLNKFLGSGAFGEVFEGVLYGETTQRIAVKTLRKGAGELEKQEFLKEAKLMSNFRHPHILQLLGISFDDDTSLIVMELMDGGDLLSVLRNCRSKGDPSLSLEDLIGICVDIAKGCKYLEEMRFVHRDLAARNCLVSTEGSRRVVKIGDFGLARDVYKSDYYRKEGEGLLPVRWMAPEALLDGVFTNSSDVWAFGVLMWEVMSLGQQPYQAMSNHDVLNFVRGGGLLACTLGCPAEMYELMLCCWRYNPEERPKFYHIVASLENLANMANSLTIYMTPTQHNYIIPSGKHNKPSESPRLTSIPLLSIGIDNFAYEPSSVTSSVSSVVSVPPALSNYSRARSLDTITEIDGLENYCNKRYAWHGRNSLIEMSDHRTDPRAELQRVLEEESKTSSCSDLSAINSEDSKELQTLRRTKRPASLEFLGGSTDDSNDITVQRASLATTVDDEPNKRYLTLLPSEQDTTDFNGYQVPLSFGPSEAPVVEASTLQRPKSVPSLNALAVQNYRPVSQYQTTSAVHNHTYQKFRPPQQYAHQNVYIPTASWC